MKSIYLKVSDEVHEILAHEAQRDGVSMSVVVRRHVLNDVGVYADGSPRPKAKRT